MWLQINCLNWRQLDLTSDNCRFKSDCDIVSLAPLYHVCIGQAVEMTNGWCQMFPIRQLNIEKTLIWSLICEQEGEGQDYLHAAVNVEKLNLSSLICAVLQYWATSCTQSDTADSLSPRLLFAVANSIKQEFLKNSCLRAWNVILYSWLLLLPLRFIRYDLFCRLKARIWCGKSKVPDLA